MKIGVSSYSFQQYLKAGKLTWEEIPEAAHALGIEALDFIDLPGETQKDRLELAAKLRAAADARGMTIVSYTIGGNLYQPESEAAKAEIARLTRQLEVAEALGATIMRHDVVYSLSAGNGRSFDLMLPVIAENTRKVCEEGEKRGIRTCTENHGYIAQDSDRVERLFNAVAHPNYGLLVDIGNFACADEDPAMAVSRVAPYAIHAHAKDFYVHSFEEGPFDGGFATRGYRYLLGAAIGDGDMPVRQCIAILRKAGYDGYLAIEYEGREDCIEGIKRGYAYLSSILG